jgi:ATP-binding cassette, subfamily B, bacterial PglK
MTTALKAVLRILSQRERKLALVVLLMAIVLGILETAGVASVMPFLSVVANPAVIDQTPVLAWIYGQFDFGSHKAFLIALGMFSAIVLITTSIFKLLTSYVTLRFVAMRRHSISLRLFGVMLWQPYSFFLNQNSSDLTKSILSETDQVVNSVLKPAVDVVSQAFVALMLVGLLVYVDPLMALIITAVLGGSYGLVYLSIRRFTTIAGRERVAANRARFRSVRDAFGGIKEIKLRGAEHTFIDQFVPVSRTYAQHQSTNQIVSLTPRYVIEGIAFATVISVVVYFMSIGKNLSGILPVVGAYVFAGYRLLPAVQQIYAGVTHVRFGLGSVESLQRDFALAKTTEPSPRRCGNGSVLSLERTLELQDVSFRYPKSKQVTLRHISLRVEARTTVGLVGSTGAGKTTIVDLLLGLLRPSEGQIVIDGLALEENNLAAWQRGIGYVPQTIYLMDDSVRANIAFGVPPAEIDNEAVEYAARLAQLHEFVMCLPDRYETRVGELGIRLSGGQRQRIGIARALYRDPQLLVLDEGTSALDGVTENAVMAAIRALANRKTIILVAHRLSTVQECRQIFYLEHGELKGSGTFEELRRTSVGFRRLARAGTARADQTTVNGLGEWDDDVAAVPSNRPQA